MAQEQDKKKSSLVRPIILGLVLVVGGFFGYKQISFVFTHETTDNAQVETQITPVLPRVSGYVKSITVNDYDTVKAGELVAELDDAELQAQLQAAQAEYAQAAVDIINAKASLNNAEVSLNVNKGNIDISDVKKAQALEEYNRNKSLYAAEAITKKQLDDSKFAYETAVKSLDNTHNDLGSAQSRIAVLQSAVKRAEATMAVKQAAIDQIKLKLTYTKIFSPQAGKIGKKNVSEGQFVQAGTPLFAIVNDTTFWVVANFKESQIASLTEGKQVDLRVDAYPDLKLTGTVASLSDATGARFALLPPDNSSGNFVKVTQRVPVKIWINEVAKYKAVLRAGLSVYVVATK